MTRCVVLVMLFCDGLVCGFKEFLDQRVSFC